MCRMKKRLCLGTSVALVFGIALFAQTKPPKAQHPAATTQARHANGNNPDRSECRGFDQQEHALVAQQRELDQRAKEFETEEKGLIAQANTIEQERVALERSSPRGANRTATENEIKSKEQQRVNLMHEADGKAKEREATLQQADALIKERKNLEAQRNQACGNAAHSNPK